MKPRRVKISKPPAIRRTPYANVTKAKCARCQSKATCEWHGVCAMGDKRFVALCEQCDTDLNALALNFVFGRSARRMLDAYRRR